MRITVFASCLAAALLSTLDVAAQTTETLAVEFPIAARPGELLVFDVQCPDGYVLSYYSSITYALILLSQKFGAIDRNGAPVDVDNPGAITSGTTGLRVFVTNDRDMIASTIVTLYCDRSSGPATIVENQATIPAKGIGSVAGICPVGKVPIGQISNVDNVSLSQRFRVDIFGFAPNFSLLDDLPDGITGPPTGMGVGATNNTDAAKVLRLFTRCVPVANAQTIITSATTAPGSLFSLAGNLPDNLDFVGFSAVGGLYGSFRHLAVWGKDGSVSSQGPYSIPDGASNTAQVRDIFIDGLDTRPKGNAAKASARAVIGILAVPSATAPPPPTIVTIVEFYNAALDHYFITAIPKEISDLDTGVHVGWQRTGQSFKAYGPGSTGRTGRRPVCRAYGNPAAHLDSHFYSASPLECVATLAGFNGAWLLEASEVFQMDLPDATTGACPASGVPIYRAWNNRIDSNHRYLTTIALRDQMVGKGYIAEGYGPDAVTLCAVP